MDVTRERVPPPHRGGGGQLTAAGASSMCGGRSRRFYRRRRTTPASGDGGGGQRANSAGHAAPTSSSRPEGERGEGGLPCDEGGETGGGRSTPPWLGRAGHGRPPRRWRRPLQKTQARTRSSGTGGGGESRFQENEKTCSFEKIIGRRSRLGPRSWSTRGQRPDTAGRNGSGNP